MIEELPKKAVISLGSNVQLRVNDQPPDFSEVQLSMDDPWLLVDTLADDPKVIGDLSEGRRGGLRTIERFRHSSGDQLFSTDEGTPASPIEFYARHDL